MMFPYKMNELSNIKILKVIRHQKREETSEKNIRQVKEDVMQGLSRTCSSNIVLVQKVKQRGNFYMINA